jgi:hypothetical protein
MNLAQFQQALDTIDTLEFMLPSGEKVPSHFHITEVGQVDRLFLDCGGKLRRESVVNFQLYTAEDFDHRLAVSKLQGIVKQSIDQLGLNPNLEIRVEHQGATIEVYGLALESGQLHLTSLQTDCLAKDKCGIEPAAEKPKIRIGATACTPGSGCC